MYPSRFTALILLILFAFAISTAYGQLGPKDATNLPPTDLERVKAGDQAPDFTLENMDGHKISLSDFRVKKNLVLVFYRGHW
jgi:cytochrome oxidase Cu insertion factor (SCO1/SenC/PrrC family)